MLVTEVEMLLWHADAAEMAKMLEWLTTRNEKFLFDMDQRVSYWCRFESNAAAGVLARTVEVTRLW